MYVLPLIFIFVSIFYAFFTNILQQLVYIHLTFKDDTHMMKEKKLITLSKGDLYGK